jgi:hypothetical protein
MKTLRFIFDVLFQISLCVLLVGGIALWFLNPGKFTDQNLMFVLMLVLVCWVGEIHIEVRKWKRVSRGR